MANKTPTYFFFLILTAISIAFVYMILPYSSSIIWGVILSLVFRPIFLKFDQKIPSKPTLSALLTIILGSVIIIIPIAFIVNSLINEVLFIRQQINSGQINLAYYLEVILNSAPDQVRELLVQYDLDNLQDVQDKFMQFNRQINLFIANHAINVGQNAFSIGLTICLMLYLLFFLLRDGNHLFESIRSVIPLSNRHKDMLFERFATVIKATIKGSLLVAIAQGILGGIYLWFVGIKPILFWIVIMSFLSLIPAVGSAIIWVPVAVYLIAIGELAQGIGLIVYGIFVIAMIDNFMRPKLVGKDTKLPDFIILITTLGGISMFGVLGFILGPMIAALFISCWSILSEVQFDAQNRSSRTSKKTSYKK